jgi:hypothetical protein
MGVLSGWRGRRGGKGASEKFPSTALPSGLTIGAQGDGKWVRGILRAGTTACFEVLGWFSVSSMMMMFCLIPWVFVVAPKRGYGYGLYRCCIGVQEDEGDKA